MCAQLVKGQIANEVAEIKAKGLRPPRLDIFLVGDRPDSLTYVHNKNNTISKSLVPFRHLCLFKRRSF